MSRNLGICLFLLTMTGFVATAFADEAAPEWPDIGTVEEWMHLDRAFHRISGIEGVTELRVYGFEQKPVYRATYANDPSEQRLDLAGFLELDAARQRELRASAARELKYVRDFHSRLRTLEMDVRDQYAAGWGTRPTDHRAIGDVLTRLHRAVGLDPTNVPAWHLLSYLRTNVGDLHRALAALDGCEEALAILPPDAMPEVRRRITLDRAWLLRDLGFLDQALATLDRLDDEGAAAREEYLIRGLIAAQTGDFTAASRIANELAREPVGIFQQDWFTGGGKANGTHSAAILDPRAWPTRPSDHLKGWIMALAWLQEGNTDFAWKVFPEYSLQRQYLYARRFMNEAGAIYEATGRPEIAARFWANSHLCVPFIPYTVYRAYGMDLRGFTGRTGTVSFVLGYDTCLMAGSRLAFGAALLGQALAAESDSMRIELGGQAVGELEICVRKESDKTAAALALGYAHVVIGEMDRARDAAELALAELARPGVDRSRLSKVEALLDLAERGAGPAWSHARQQLTLRRAETPAETEDRLRAAYAADPGSQEARRELARFLIRHGQLEAGDELVEQAFGGDSRPRTDDWILALELDHLRHDASRAEEMLGVLRDGRAGQWPSARLWMTVGILCLENGVAGGREALEYAAELEPDNAALRTQLEMTAP